MTRSSLGGMLLFVTGLLTLSSMAWMRLATGDCNWDCPLNMSCTGLDAGCPQCFGFGADACGVSTAIQNNPALLVIRKRVQTSAYTGLDAQFQDEVICYRTAACSYGAPLPGMLCSGAANLCMSAVVPYVYCTPCGINVPWTNFLTNDYHCVTCY